MSTNNNKRYFFSAWLICGLGALFYSYEYFLRILPSVMEVPLRHHFDLTAAGFGFLSAFYYYAYVPMQLPVGILMDRYGPRRLLTVACIICVCGTLVFSNTIVFRYAAIARFFVGLGSAFGFVGVLKLATIWLPENKMGFVAGMASALGAVSAAIGDNLFGMMVHSVGWKGTVEWSAFAGLLLAFVLWVGVRDKGRYQRHSGTINSFKKSVEDLFIILRNGQIWINGMYGCLVYLPATVFAELWGIPYLIHGQGLSHVSAQFCNSMLFLGFTIGAPVNGYISDRIRRRKLPMLVGAVGAAIVRCVVLYVPNLGQSTLVVLMLLLGLLYSAQTLVFAVGRELSPKEAAGTAIAATNMLVMLGAIFLQPFIGRLLDLSQLRHLAGVTQVIDTVEHPVHVLVHSAADYQFALSIIPIGIVIAAILTFFLRETYAAIEGERQE